MVVKLEFINLLIPIANIKKCSDFDISKDSCRDIEWFDQYIYRTGAMNPYDIDDIVEEWISRGLSPVVEETDVKKWSDLCVVDTYAGLTLPCDWIEVNLDERCAWFKDVEKGTAVGPENRETVEGIIIK